MTHLMKLFLGARVAKTSIAAGLALYFASLLDFTGYTYAALVAVLATQKSMARSFGLAKYQVVSALIGTLGGNLVALQFGTHPLFGALLVYALFAVHLKLGWRNTILLSLVTGINSFSTFQGELFVHALKQVSIVLIGIGCSIVVNLVAVPRYEQKLEELIERSEGMLRGLIYLMYNNLTHLEQGLSEEEYGKQVQDVRKYMQEARHYAELIFEDQWIYNRKGIEAKQAIQTLQQMELLASHILILNKALDKVGVWVEAIPHIQRFMDVLMRIQLRVFRGKTVHFQLADQAIQFLDQVFREMELPKNRLEFVSRAALYHFYEELKEYYEDLKRIRSERR
ncbi:aromatic acid exporter family protein [Effusibacillus consociatus]|uniref:Aromatic acid exporter family protein n=1 Tax=Effusibacillus consociatus TaxID=1117041 RepID=A0ABV9Q9T1_9BACL